MGHIGLTPQTATMLGGHKAQGRQWRRTPGGCTTDALALEAGGLLRDRARVRARRRSPTAITRRLAIPTIGIGSGAGTDGQVLVLHDLLGIRRRRRFQPRFVKRYAQIGEAMREGVAAYATEVRGRAYPGRGAHLPDRARGALGVRRPRSRPGSADDNILADW